MTAAQYAYDNQYDSRLEVPLDGDDFPPTDENKTYLVERFVTYANAAAFESIRCMEWLGRQIGFEADHWSVGFVADELEAL